MWGYEQANIRMELAIQREDMYYLQILSYETGFVVTHQIQLRL